MSRLTKKDLHGKYTWEWNTCMEEMAQKLGKYEDLGAPEDLVKVVRCQNCISYDTNPPNPEMCEIRDNYCSHGVKRKESVSEGFNENSKG